VLVYIRPDNGSVQERSAHMAAADDMQLWDPRGAPTIAHREVYESVLPLKGATILELGCGNGDTSRAIAKADPTASVTAMEVDVVQHEANLASAQLPNLHFVLGGAEKVPADDESFDIVLMVKSLHHVPGDMLDWALKETRRVLKPGGLAYIAEPVFSGAFNEIIRVFHDEEQVRLNAFAAVKNAVARGGMELVAEKFFFTPVKIENFEAFERRFINVTHTDHRLSKAQREEVEKKFARHMKPQGAVFNTPMRADVLRRTG